MTENEEWMWAENYRSRRAKEQKEGPEGRRYIAVDVIEIDLMNNSCGRH